jgi:Arc/MetJ family transcription regulator
VKHLVDIDERALAAARTQLGTRTIRDTVNEALARAAGTRAAEVKASLDHLAASEFGDRDDPWR